MEQKPSVGRTVHYVSHGTPVRGDGSQAYTSQCRAAIITAVRVTVPGHEKGAPYVDLCVLNPEGLFFNQNVSYDEGAGEPGDPNCPNPHEDGPHRYCACGWIEPTKRGGTWHWPERV